LVICYTENGTKVAKKYQNKGCAIYAINHFPTLLTKIVPLVKGSCVVLCDNYYAFLAGMNFFEETVVVQLWHANGAIKLFGLNANYAKKASLKDQKRYLEVYKKFTHYVVSSEKMARIFKNNYRQKIVQLPFGYLPTDYYFKTECIKDSKKNVREHFQTSKKIALYAPTYREKKSNIPLDFSKLSHLLGSEWLLFVKAHPHDELLKQRLSHEANIITDFKGMSLQEILPSVDCLITDYSSIPFEYSLANPIGKIIFFCYDLSEYQKEVGIENDFMDWAPGKIVRTESELIKEIQNETYQNLDSFNQLWNEYVTGNATNQLIEWVEKKYANRKDNGNIC
jgi:CDP-glycerol glycerophosphotransferase (TagB/SpsB family)